MAQRAAVVLILWLVTLMSSPIARADSSGPELASYYERHMALLAGVAYGWFGRGAPQRMRDAVVQVGVSQDAYFALLEDGSLLTWSEAPAQAALLMQGVTSFAVGRSGWFAIDRAQVLWYGRAAGVAVRRVAADVVAASIGDGADYYVTGDGTLYVKGLAHRGQYGDQRIRGHGARCRGREGAHRARLVPASRGWGHGHRWQSFWPLVVTRPGRQSRQLGPHLRRGGDDRHGLASLGRDPCQW